MDIGDPLGLYKVKSAFVAPPRSSFIEPTVTTIIKQTPPAEKPVNQHQFEELSNIMRDFIREQKMNSPVAQASLETPASNQQQKQQQQPKHPIKSALKNVKFENSDANAETTDDEDGPTSDCDIEVDKILKSKRRGKYEKKPKPPAVETKTKKTVRQKSRPPSSLAHSGRISRSGRRATMVRSPRTVYRHRPNRLLNSNGIEEVPRDKPPAVCRRTVVEPKRRLQRIASVSKRIMKTLRYPLLCVSSVYLFSGKYGDMSAYLPDSMSSMAPLLQTTLGFFTRNILLQPSLDDPLETCDYSI